MPFSLNRRTIKTIAIALPLAALIFYAGFWFCERDDFLTQGGFQEKRLSTFGQHQKDYQFIDPLLSCQTIPKKEPEEFKDLKDRLTQVIDRQIAQGKAAQISVHFDTNDGRWLSINPDEVYSPASLAKVPLAIAWLKQAEIKPEILKQTIVYDGSFDDNGGEHWQPSQTLTVGQAYTAEDLLSRMIKYSDNNAAHLLRDKIDKNSLKEIFGDLGVVLPTENNEAVDFLTTKQYINFFQELYNATYLSRDKSEKLLRLLSQIDFSEGLQAGLPSNITVAHKFGERIFPLDLAKADYSLKELHDCGIVYYPAHPYLLCIMTKGRDFKDLSGVIGELSRAVYDFKEERYKR